MIRDMIEKGYRAYSMDTAIFKRYFDTIQKKLGLEIVIAGEKLLFVKTTLPKRW